MKQLLIIECMVLVLACNNSSSNTNDTTTPVTTARPDTTLDSMYTQMKRLDSINRPDHVKNNDTLHTVHYTIDNDGRVCRESCDQLRLSCCSCRRLRSDV